MKTQGCTNSMENIVYLNPKNKDKLIETATKELVDYLVIQADRGVPLEAHEISAINSKIGEQGIYQQKIREIQKDANKLTYTAPDGTVYKGFVNILRAARRGGISSEILDTTKYANIYSRLRTAYSQSKTYAEDSLHEPMRSGIRER